MNKEQFVTMMSQIAQGTINISEGKHNTFEIGCPFHKALEDLCEAVNIGEVGLIRTALEEMRRTR